MLVESGLTIITGSDGAGYTFRPSFERIARLGTPRQIIQSYVSLYGEKAAQEARFILVSLCDQEDVTPLVGWIDSDGADQAGQMPELEMIVIAQHLMRHGIVGTAKSSKGDGKQADSFEVEEYLASARIHLGLSLDEALALSMTELWRLFDMKFPDANKKRDVPTREEYRAAMGR